LKKPGRKRLKGIQVKKIPYDKLSPEVKTEINLIKSRKGNRRLGAVVWPACITVSSIVPAAGPVMAGGWGTLFGFCFSYNTKKIRENHKKIRKIMRKNDLVGSLYKSPEFKYENLKKNYTHFYVNWKSDLVLLKEPRKGFLKKLLVKRAHDLTVNKKQRQSFFKTFFNKFSPGQTVKYEHLKPQVKSAVRNVKQTRETRKIHAKVAGMSAAGLNYSVRSVMEIPEPGLPYFLGKEASAVIAAIAGFTGAYLWRKKDVLDSHKTLQKMVETHGFVTPEYEHLYDMKTVKRKQPFFVVLPNGDLKFLKYRRRTLRKKLKA
jgi:hypothetical protein